MLRVHFQSMTTLGMGVCGAQFLESRYRTTVVIHVTCRKCRDKICKGGAK
jgi:hypothetical protein